MPPIQTVEPADDVLGAVDQSKADPETEAKINRTNATTEAIKTVTATWEDQSRQERLLRRDLGVKVFAVFVGEVMAGFGLLVLVGMNVLRFPQWVATVFFAGVFSHTAFMLSKVVHYLFDDRTTPALNMILKGVLKQEID